MQVNHVGKIFCRDEAKQLQCVEVGGDSSDSECNIMHYNNCSICCIVQYLNMTKLELSFYYETYCINSTCTLFMITHALQGHYAGMVV